MFKCLGWSCFSVCVCACISVGYTCSRTHSLLCTIQNDSHYWTLCTAV